MAPGTTTEELEQDEEHGYRSLSSGWSENQPPLGWLVDAGSTLISTPPRFTKPVGPLEADR